MRKPAILLPFLLLLCGCRESGIPPAAPDMDKCYTVNITSVTDSGEKLSALLTRGGTREWTLEISEPYALSGAVLKISGGRITASYEGFSAEVPLDAGIYSSFMDVTGVFERLTDMDTLSMVNDKKGFSVSGDNFTVFFEERLPVRIVLDDTGADIALAGFTVTAGLPDGDNTA